MWIVLLENMLNGDVGSIILDYYYNYEDNRKTLIKAIIISGYMRNGRYSGICDRMSSRSAQKGIIGALPLTCGILKVRGGSKIFHLRNRILLRHSATIWCNQHRLRIQKKQKKQLLIANYNKNYNVNNTNNITKPMNIVEILKQYIKISNIKSFLE